MTTKVTTVRMIRPTDASGEPMKNGDMVGRIATYLDGFKPHRLVDEALGAVNEHFRETGELRVPQFGGNEAQRAGEVQPVPLRMDHELHSLISDVASVLGIRNSTIIRSILNDDEPLQVSLVTLQDGKA